LPTGKFVSTKNARTAFILCALGKWGKRWRRPDAREANRILSTVCAQKQEVFNLLARRKQQNGEAAKKLAVPYGSRARSARKTDSLFVSDLRPEELTAFSPSI